jgi:hypothetical protein
MPQLVVDHILLESKLYQSSAHKFPGSHPQEAVGNHGDGLALLAVVVVRDDPSEVVAANETFENGVDTVLIQEEYDQQLAVAFNRGQEQHSQKLTLAFIQEEEDLKLAVALFQEDRDRKLAVALTQEEQDRLLALSLIEKITKQTHLQDQRLLLTSNNEFEPRTPYETNGQD